jgi:hypothetical protein
MLAAAAQDERRAAAEATRQDAGTAGSAQESEQAEPASARSNRQAAHDDPGLAAPDSGCPFRLIVPCEPAGAGPCPGGGFDEARRPIRLGAMMPEPGSGERALRSKFMLIFRGGAVARHDLSPSELQAHVEKWYRWSDELARQGRRNAGTALDNPGAAVRGHERVVTDGPYAESKDLVTGSMIFEAASLEDAIDVARTCPTYEFGGSVEVRPVQGPGI